MKYLRTILLLLFLIVLPIHLFCDSPQVEVYSMYELSLDSDYQYSNPYTDSHFYAEFTSPSNEKIKVFGFWAGDNVFKVRFMPRQIGKWTWKTTSEINIDDNLNNKSGEFIVIENTKDNDFAKKGIPRVSDDKRYITYENGEPLFLVNEISWRLPLSSLKDEVLKYITDRKSKGFNAVSMVIIDTFYEWGDSTRNGERLFVNYDNNQINPKFFDYVDWAIQTINDSGMVALLTPLWGAISEVNTEAWIPKNFEKTKSIDYCKYCAARYAGNNIIWIVGGDCNYFREGSFEFWDSWAKFVKEYSGGYQLITSHTIGYSGTYDYFNDVSWLDFHTYQSSHVIGIDYSWKGAKYGWEKSPQRPIINLEPSFEDLNEFRNDDLKIRIDYNDIRKAMYEGIFTGAFAGLSYGANGIFNWYSPELKVWFNPTYKIDSAIYLPGSGQVHLIKDFCYSIGWPRLTPTLDLQLKTDNEKVIASCCSDSFFVAYFPSHTVNGRFNLSNLVQKGFSFKWVNPVDLSTSNYYINNDTNLTDISFVPPDTSAVILLVKRNDTSDVLKNESLDRVNIYPNPAQNKVNIEYYKNSDESLLLEIYDNLGNLYGKYEISNNASVHNVLSINSSELKSGVYYLSVKRKNTSESYKFEIVK